MQTPRFEPEKTRPRAKDHQNEKNLIANTPSFSRAQKLYMTQVAYTYNENITYSTAEASHAAIR